MAIKIPDSLRGEWTGYKCYVTYLALKLHFSGSYDFFKYGGKTSASVSSYETRRDRYQFEKLARHLDPVGVMLAHLSADPKAWIGAISPTSETYTAFVRRTDAIPYTLRSDLSNIKDDIDDNLEVPDGQHPYLLSALIADRVSLESVCVLQSLYNFVPYWDEAIKDPIIWPENRKRILKLLPFLDIDKQKAQEVIDSRM